MTLQINGVRTDRRKDLKTWGDLVADLDRQLAASGDVVTVVRLDGIEEPAFREPALASRSLDTFTSVAVETGSPDTLARACLGDTASALGTLSLAARTVADGFRGDDVSQARADLEQISIGLVAVLRIVSAAGLALRREFEAPDTDGRSVSALSATLDGIIRNLLDGQQNQDWLLVADILEFDLHPALANWQQTIARIAA